MKKTEGEREGGRQEGSDDYKSLFLSRALHELWEKSAQSDIFIFSALVFN